MADDAMFEEALLEVDALISPIGKDGLGKERCTCGFDKLIGMMMCGKDRRIIARAMVEFARRAMPNVQAVTAEFGVPLSEIVRTSDIEVFKENARQKAIERIAHAIAAHVTVKEVGFRGGDDRLVFEASVRVATDKSNG